MFKYNQNNFQLAIIDIVDCYIELPVNSSNISSLIGSDGSSDSPYLLGNCSKLCYDDLNCAAFQWEDSKCYRHYYDKSTGNLAIPRMPAVIYIKSKLANKRFTQKQTKEKKTY